MDLRSGAAFWPVRSGLLASYPALAHDEHADVVVIGAGVTGALVAHALVAAGANVVVLDKRDVASGSSAATTGLLMHETDVDLGELIASNGEPNAVRAWRLGLEAVEAIEGLVGQLPERCGFEWRDSLYVASSDEDARALGRECAVRRGQGFDVDFLTPDDVRRRYGFDATGALLGRGNAQIDCYRFTHRLLQSATERGARVYDRSTVERVEADADGVMVTTDRGSTVRAARVVWAAGYEGVEETQRKVGTMHSTWVVASEPVADFGPWSDRALIWETARPYLYARATDDGRVIVGGEDEPFSRGHASQRRMERKSKRLVERFNALFPTIGFETAYRWAGVFSTTRDGLPYIGSVPEHPRAWLALGYGGNGITFSMIASQLIRDAWLGVANPDARIFAFDR